MKTPVSLMLMMTGLLVAGFAQADHHQGGMHGDHVPPMFEKFDTDKDGRLSKEEMRAGMDKMFGEVDTNKDGFLSKEEMAAHHQSMHEQMHQKMKDRMQERWKAADKDGDGALSKAEVDAANMPRLARDFDKLDKNKDGKLSPDEVRSMMPAPPPK